MLSPRAGLPVRARLVAVRHEHLPQRGRLLPTGRVPVVEQARPDRFEREGAQQGGDAAVGYRRALGRATGGAGPGEARRRGAPHVDHQ